MQNHDVDGRGRATIDDMLIESVKVFSMKQLTLIC